MRRMLVLFLPLALLLAACLTQEATPPPDPIVWTAEECEDAKKSRGNLMVVCANGKLNSACQGYTELSIHINDKCD